MRNLKRALSLALAAIMLLGMMVMGTSAVSIDDFTDSDAVQNVEAVTLTSGLGIFQGRTDGSFDPTAPVTRAEMAVIICKILHGADVSPDNFTGTQQFTDVPAWAEGYVNMCSALGIIAGRGNGIFDPDTTVTTVEAATMLLKALGYYVTVNDALGADWDLEVTSRANALKLYGDLTLNMRAPLTRDNVAELVYNTLFAQMVAFNDYRGQYVKNTNRDVVVTAGTDDEANTLAYNTFKLYVAEGVVMANGYTEKALVESSTNNAQTTVMFTEDTDLDKDGRKEFSEGDEFDFNAGTSLNLIGHAVKVYYTYTKKAPIVYAITDQAALTAVIEYDKNTTRLAEAANDAGFKKNSILDVDLDDYKINYDMDVTLKDIQDTSWSDGAPVQTRSGTYDLNAMQGKKLLLIANSGNLDLSGEYDYVIVLDQYLDVVKEVEEIRGDVEYVLKTNAFGHATNGDVNIPLYSDVTEDDYVIATNIGLKDEVVVFYEANLMDATITRISGVSDNNAPAKKITADGVVYIVSSVWDNTTNLTTDLLTRFVDVKDLKDETLILDEFGEMIGITEAATVRNYAYIAQFGETHTTGVLNTNHQLTAHVYYFDADGNLVNGIFPVDKFADLADSFTGTVKDLDPANDVPKVKGNTASINQDNGNSIAGGALGVWNVKIKDNGHIEISKAYEFSNSNNADDDDVRLVKGHSTFVKNNYAVHDNAGPAAGLPADGTGYIMYQNNSTVYFYVDGKYNDQYTGADDIDVSAFIGIKNAPGFTNDKTPGNDIGIQQVFTHYSSNKQMVTAVLVEDVEVYSSQVYYYNQGNYHYSSDGLTYELYDMDGNLVEKTYPKLKKADAAEKWDGFYLIKNDNIYPYNIDSIMTNAQHEAGFTYLGTPASIDGNPAHNLYAWSDGLDATTETKKGDKTYYVVNDIAEYDEIVENFFGRVTPQGNIAENVKIVDACNSGLNTMAKVVRAIKDIQAVGGDHSNLLISYTYNTDDYTIKSFFISKYDPDETEAPGNRSGNRYFNDSIVANLSGTSMTVNADVYARRTDTTALTAPEVSVTGVSNVTVKYTIKAYNWITGETSSYGRVTRNAASITGAGAFSDSVTIPKFLADYTNGEVTFTATWKGSDGKTYSAVGTFEY